MDETKLQLKEHNGQPLQNQQPPADSIHGGGTAANAAARDVHLRRQFNLAQIYRRVMARAAARAEGGGK